MLASWLLINPVHTVLRVMTLQTFTEGSQLSLSVTQTQSHCTRCKGLPLSFIMWTRAKTVKVSFNEQRGVRSCCFMREGEMESRQTQQWNVAASKWQRNSLLKQMFYSIYSLQRSSDYPAFSALYLNISKKNGIISRYFLIMNRHLSQILSNLAAAWLTDLPHQHVSCQQQNHTHVHHPVHTHPFLSGISAG